jgi:NAD(P)-dependent dehydrogenase (short-subunit alcohol dehydrogenase family)
LFACSLQAIGKSSSACDWGVIINNSSTLSSRVRTGSAESIALYAASKSAVDTLTQFAAIEGAPLHVRVNAVNPGMTRPAPPPTDALAPGASDQFANMCAQSSLVPTPNTTDELAAFVMFVADNKTGRFFNGSLLRMDGGLACK